LWKWHLGGAEEDEDGVSNGRGGEDDEEEVGVADPPLYLAFGAADETALDLLLDRPLNVVVAHLFGNTSSSSIIIIITHHHR
jgi:hypothetical protein